MRQLIIILVLFCQINWAKAQIKNWHSVGIETGIRSLKIGHSLAQYRYLNYSPTDTSTISGQIEAIPPNTQMLIGLGADWYLKNDWVLVTKIDFQLNKNKGFGFQVGAARRYRLNYMIKLQPELLFNFSRNSFEAGTQQVQTINNVPFYSDTLNDYELELNYRLLNYSLQPGLRMLVKLSNILELRLLAQYNVGLLNSQSLIIKGNLSPFQTTTTRISFTDENMDVEAEGEPISKSLIQLGGFSARIGLALRF